MEMNKGIHPPKKCFPLDLRETFPVSTKVSFNNKPQHKGINFMFANCFQNAAALERSFEMRYLQM